MSRLTRTVGVQLDDAELYGASQDYTNIDAYDEGVALADDEENFDLMVERYIEASKNFTLPEYLPIDRATKTKVEHFNNKINAELIQRLKNDLIQSTDSFLLHHIEGPDDANKDGEQGLEEALKNSLATLEKLSNLQTELKVLINATQVVKGEVRTRCAAQPELSYDTIDSYRQMQNPPSNLGELFVATFAEEQARSGAVGASMEKELLELQQHAFVVKHPLEPLPNHLQAGHNRSGAVDEEDDVEIEGGKIELRCPISRQQFTNPVKSKKCGHTFSKTSILEYLRSNRECPIPGCGAQLTMSDFETDTLVNLRVKSYGAIKFKEEKQRRKNIEVVS